MDRLRIISDLHQLDKGRRDDFKQEGKLLDFCRQSIADSYRLVFNGDILELWQNGDIDGIFRSYARFWEYIAGTQSIFISGNHDADWLRRSLAKKLWSRFGIHTYKSLIIDDNAREPQVPEQLCPYIRYKSDKPEGGALVFHGHQYDPLGKSALGWIATAAAGVIEKHWWEDIDLYWSRNKILPPKRNEEYYEELAMLAESIGVTNVVFGHTHRPVMIDHERGSVSCKIMNCGSWVNGHSDYLQYNKAAWKLEVF